MITNKIYKDENEMIEENKTIQKQALKDLQNADADWKKSRKKKIIIWVSCIITIFVIFKIFVGEIILENIASYNKNRWYIVKINNESTTVHVDEKQYTTIIPFMVRLKSISTANFYGDDPSISEIQVNKGDDINMTIESYTCSYEAYDMQMPCNSDKEKLIKTITNDTTYNLFIRRNKHQEVMYDGVLINDISKYFPENGGYFVYITGNYKNVVSYISFIVNVVEE